MKLRKAPIAIIMAIATLGTLTSCNATIDKNEQTSAYVETIQQPNYSQDIEKEITLKDINPKFTQSKGYVYIDEESALKIIRIAMEDVKDYYVSIGAPNMQYDKNLKIIEGDNHFYPEWMNEYYYLARAMSESSLKVNATNFYYNTKGEKVNVEGIMQLSDGKEGIKASLEKYWRDVFHENCDLSSLVVIPSNEDLKNAKTSKQSQENIVKAVYNNIYLSICYDVYSAKCLNPIKHADYYANYGGFDEEIRRLATIGFYGTNHGWVLSGLRNGNLEEVLNNIEDMDIYLANMKKYENQFREKYEKSLVNEDEYQFGG